MLADGARIVIDGIILNGTSDTTATAHTELDTHGEHTVNLSISGEVVLIQYPNGRTDQANGWPEAVEKMKKNFFDKIDSDLKARTAHRAEYDPLTDKPDGRGKLLAPDIVIDRDADGNFIVYSKSDTAQNNAYKIKTEDGRLTVTKTGTNLKDRQNDLDQVKKKLEKPLRQYEKNNEAVAALRASFKT